MSIDSGLSVEAISGLRPSNFRWSVPDRFLGAAFRWGHEAYRIHALLKPFTLEGSMIPITSLVAYRGSHIPALLQFSDLGIFRLTLRGKPLRFSILFPLHGDLRQALVEILEIVHDHSFRDSIER